MSIGEILANPTVSAIVGAVVASILTAIVSFIAWYYTRKEKKIRATIRDVSSLLEISKEIKAHIDLKIDGDTVDSLFVSSIDVSNIGSLSIENQIVIVVFPASTRILGASIKTVPENGFQVKLISQDDNIFKFELDLINPKEFVRLEILSTENSSNNVEIIMRNKNVFSEVFDARGNALKIDSLVHGNNILLLGILSTIPLLGSFPRLLIDVGIARSLSKQVGSPRSK